MPIADWLSYFPSCKKAKQWKLIWTDQFSDCHLTCEHCQQKFDSVSAFNEHLKNCYTENNIEIQKYTQIQQINPGWLFIDVFYLYLFFSKNFL